MRNLDDNASGPKESSPCLIIEWRYRNLATNDWLYRNSVVQLGPLPLFPPQLKILLRLYPPCFLVLDVTFREYKC